VALTVLHVAPHPDDEVIAAPGTLLGLRRAGHRVVNLACSLGRPGQHERRRGEVGEACRRAGFELVVHEPPLAISSGDDLGLAERVLAASLASLVADLGARLVVAPSEGDGHHGHAVVGRAALRALAYEGAPPVWSWGLWASLRHPTLYVPFGEPVLEEALEALRAHAGELARNDYEALVRARATAARVQGAELVFGLGAPAREGPYADVLEERAFAAGAWRSGPRREPDLTAPVPG
jgi:LmbE family N-acetylglucosaminyl deacetylase